MRWSPIRVSCVRICHPVCERFRKLGIGKMYEYEGALELAYGSTIYGIISSVYLQALNIVM